MDTNSEKEQKIFSAVKNGVAQNSTDAPQISIDPDSEKLAVVGDPNMINQTDGTYKLTFRYDADQLSDADKEQMKLDEETGEYTVDITYEHRRVKPLYREKIVLLVSDLFNKLGVVNVDGYDIDALKPNVGRTLMENVETIAEIARMVCGIKPEQVEQLDTLGLAMFIQQFLVNEPNILKEAVVFLAQQLASQGKNPNAKVTIREQNTQQS